MADNEEIPLETPPPTPTDQANDIIRRLTQSGVLQSSDKVEIIACNPLISDSNFTVSTLYTLHIRVTANDPPHDMHLLVKQSFTTFTFGDERVNLDVHYRNEEIFYKETLPKVYLAHRDLFPRFYYSDVSASNKTFILEDLSACGYRMSDSVNLLSSDHTRLTVDKLGLFHGMSFAFKENNPKEMRDLSSKGEEIRFTEKQRVKNAALFAYAKEIAMRSLDMLEKTGKYREEVFGKLRNEFEDIFAFFKKHVTTTEPFGTITHGDFQRNNLMYKYDNDKPIAIKFIDFQTPRYTSPACDLALYLEMNVDPTERRERFDEYFQIYHDSLTKVLQEQCPNYDREHYSHANMLRDYGQHVLYGWLNAAYFSPIAFHGGLVKFMALFGEKMGAMKTNEEILEFVDLVWTKEVREFSFDGLQQILDRFFVS